MTPQMPEILAKNVRRLLGLTPEQSGVQRLIDLGIANGTAQRILAGQTSVGLAVVGELAERLHVEPWQLLVPDLDPQHLPSIDPSSRRWPFRRIDEQALTSLSGTVAGEVERGMMVALSTAGVVSAIRPAEPVRPGPARSQPHPSRKHRTAA